MQSHIHRERARIAGLTRSRAADDPELLDAKRNLAEANIAAYVEKVLRTAPPLSDEQRTRLAELLRPARHPGDRKTVVKSRLAELDGGA